MALARSEIAAPEEREAIAADAVRRSAPLPLRRILYLPMEIAARELDSRLLIAALALARGFEIVLGQKWLMERNIAAMPPGIYLAKTLTKRDAAFMAAARQAGYLVGALDEEIPGLQLAPSELRWMAEEAVTAAHRIFVAGAGNRDSVAERFPGAADRIRACMNPRWDLLGPRLRSIYAAEAEDLRRRFGAYFLINTNLGFINSEKGKAEDILKEQVRLGKLDLANPDHATYFRDIVAMEEANRAAILDLLPRLQSAFPDRHIVLRPHPSERLETWREDLRGRSGISVIRDGSAIPWILGSAALIHTNCTTGIEAIALDRPAICLIPIETHSTRRYIVNRLNPVARNAAETVTLLADGRIADPPAFYSPAMRTDFAAAMSLDPARLGAAALLDELMTVPGFSLAAPGPQTQFAPRVGYRWHIADRNVRGSLYPTIRRSRLRQRLQAIAAALDLDIPLTVQNCGTKLVLLGPHPLPWPLRLRRYFGGRLLARLQP